MQIAEIMTKGESTGKQIMILSKVEAMDLHEIVMTYCEQNKRKRKAKVILKQLDDNFQIY